MFRKEMFISGNSETGVPELNLASIPYMGSPEGLRQFLFRIRGDGGGHFLREFKDETLFKFTEVTFMCRPFGPILCWSKRKKGFVFGPFCSVC
jgi:hypothetical protein